VSGLTPRGDGRGYNSSYSQIEIGRLANVRFTPKADIRSAKTDVRFVP
jgi:hypothetical protein